MKTEILVNGRVRYSGTSVRGIKNEQHSYGSGPVLTRQATPEELAVFDRLPRRPAMRTWADLNGKARDNW